MELCPQALLVNYANPMTAITRAIHKATDANVIGLCHGVNHTQGYLARLAELPQAETSISVIGVNHCTWITEFRHQGCDAWPAIDRRLESAEVRSVLAEPPSGADSPFSEKSPFSWELYDIYKAFPAPLDRHVTEFYPSLCRENAYYGRTLGIDAFSLEGTIAEGDRTFAHMSAIARAEEPLNEDVFDHVPGEHEQLVTILACLSGRGRGVFSTNLPNQGRVPGVPREAIVEGMTLIDENGFRPLAVEQVSLPLRDQMVRRATVTELTVDAALAGELELMVQAIQVEGSLSKPSEARALAWDLILAQAAYLPQFKL
jgi:alpha-galactosidase